MAGEEYVSYSDYLLLQRERDEARTDLEFRRGLYKVQEQYLETARRERDEAREKAERYRLDANALMLQRDEAREEINRYREKLDLLPISWNV